jgi:hypothetical protein
MSVRTSFSSRRPTASAFTRGRGSASVRTRVTRPHSRYPRGRGTASARMRKREKNKLKKYFFIYFFWYLLPAWKGRNNFQFSIFNPQNPRNLRAPRASQAQPQEEEGFFGLVPLVTHPSSIPLLGGLTPKFLSLSLHSL